MEDNASPPPAWFRTFPAPATATTPLSQPVYELNRQLVDLLVKASISNAPQMTLVRQFQDPLRSLSEAGRDRIARQFYLLVDFRFTDLEWWRSRRRTGRAGRDNVACFPKSAAIHLGRTAITILRHASCLSAKEATLLGAHPEVLMALAALSGLEIERILERNHFEVTPRWHTSPALWHGLIRSAASPDVRLKRDAAVKGLQTLARELL